MAGNIEERNHNRLPVNNLFHMRETTTLLDMHSEASPYLSTPSGRASRNLQSYLAQVGDGSIEDPSEEDTVLRSGRPLRAGARPI